MAFLNSEYGWNLRFFVEHSTVKDGVQVFAASNDDDLLDFTAESAGLIVHAIGGDDTVIGTGFDDEIHGGAGDDTLTGGDGDDLFVYGFRNAGDDTIMDFTSDGTEEDVLDISVLLDGATKDTISDFINLVDSNGTDAGGDLVFNIDINGDGSGADVTVTLQGFGGSSALDTPAATQAYLEQMIDSGSLIVEEDPIAQVA